MKIIVVVAMITLLLLFSSCDSNFNVPTPSSDISEYKSLLDNYISTGNASDELISLYEQADSIELIPMYDYDTLEPIEYEVYQFFKTSKLIGLRVMRIDSEAISEAGEKVVLNQTLYEHLSKCYTDFDGRFKVCGAVYSETLTLFRYFFGKLDGEGAFMLYGTHDSTLKPFKRVEKDFTTIEEGISLHKQYIENKAIIKESVPVFPWKTVEIGENGWYILYGPEFYDYAVPCPLLDKNGEEGRYMVHLVYYRNQLIGEVLMERTAEQQERWVSTRYGEKNEETNLYGKLEHSVYLEVIESFKREHPNTEIAGVRYDGEKYTVIPVS